jgi:hydrogenase-4 component D
MLPVLLITMLLLPFAGALLSQWLPEKRQDGFAAFVVALATAASLWALFAGYGRTFAFPVMGWPWLPQQTQVLGVYLDPLSVVLLLVTTIIGLLVTFYSRDYISPRNLFHPMEGGKRRFYLWHLLFVGAMIGVAVSPNFLQMFIFWELTTICSWALISYYHNKESLDAGFEALIKTFFGGIFFLIALIVLFVNTGSFGFDAINLLTPQTKTLVFVLFLIAAWAKSSQIVFFAWLPNAMAAPTPVSCYLHAAAMVKAGVYLMARVTISTVGFSYGLGLLMAVFAVFTMLAALFLFFFQNDLKKFLAYSTIAHLGYIFLGIGLGVMGSHYGYQGAILHIICHAPAKALLFICVGCIAYATGTRNMDELGGLAKAMPLTSVAFIIGTLGVTGIAPLSCYWSKLFLMEGVIETGGKTAVFLMIPFVAELIIAFAWYFFVAHKVFFGEPSAKVNRTITLPLNSKIIMVVLIVLTVIAPLVGLPLVKLVR